MERIIACLECGVKLRLSDEFLGKKVKCPSCAQAFRVPMTPPETPSPPPEPETAIAATPASVARKTMHPAPDEDEPTPRPRRRRARGFDAIAFSVKVKDPDKEFKGTMKAKLTPEGLFLTYKKEEILLPAGDGAEHIRSNVLSVPYEGRDLELTILKPFTYVKRLTVDTADFLDGRLDDLHEPDYRIPWYLILLAMLPIGIPVISLGGALPGILGGGMAGLSLVIAQREQWSLAVRVVLCLTVAVVAYAIFGALLVWVLMKQ